MCTVCIYVCTFAMPGVPFGKNSGAVDTVPPDLISIPGISAGGN